jgi:hypothetical protein
MTQAGLESVADSPQDSIEVDPNSREPDTDSINTIPETPDSDIDESASELGTAESVSGNHTEAAATNGDDDDDDDCHIQDGILGFRGRTQAIVIRPKTRDIGFNFLQFLKAARKRMVKILKKQVRYVCTITI